ncbi:hypothetical protein [Helicobacter pylori]|nr:hypothetical protein [Helicobacter pylori]
MFSTLGLSPTNPLAFLAPICSATGCAGNNTLPVVFSADTRLFKYIS